jgi:hypothetical protein
MNITAEQSLSISAVERETGISKDVLRKWESRYGFPAPLRDDQGERSYPPDQVARLRLIKRLMDTGLRPSRIVGESVESLDALARSSRVTAPLASGARRWPPRPWRCCAGKIRQACGNACGGNC